MLLSANDKQKIGRAGELLTQYKLLKYGIDSSLMTTDNGIDLVAFPPSRNTPMTIQVKTNLKPKPGGGKGKLALEWRMKRHPEVDFFALVNMEADEVWLFSYDEMVEYSQQKPNENLMQFYMYDDPTTKIRTGKMGLKYQFQGHLIENYIHKII